MNLSQLTLSLIVLMVIIFTVNSCDNQITQPEKEEPVSEETTFIPFNPNSQSGNDISRNKAVSRKAPSQFGCSLSTLNPQNEDEFYRHQAFFIRFPEKVVEEADGKVANRSFALSSDRAEERTPEFLNKKGVVRFLTCRIPDSPEALHILEVEMQKFGGQSWYTDIDASEKTRQKGGEWVCQYVPGDGYGNISSSITIEGITYITYYFHEVCEFVWEGEPIDELIEDPFGGTGGSGISGGGNSGDTGSGSSPDPCPSLEGTAVTYIIDESGESLGCIENAVEDIEAELWEEKIIDDELDPCMQTIVQDLKGIETGVGKIIQKFAGETPGYNWELKSGSLGGSNAVTSQRYNSTTGTVTTTFDPQRFINATDLSLARTILHEAVHAYIVAYFGNDYLGAKKKFPEFIEDFSKGEYPTRNDTDHAEFVRNYVEDISYALQQFGQGKGYSISSTDYQKLAWGGLTHWRKRDESGEVIKDANGNSEYEETPWFKAEFPTSTERNNVLNIIFTEQGFSNTENQKGTDANC